MPNNTKDVCGFAGLRVCAFNAPTRLRRRRISPQPAVRLKRANALTILLPAVLMLTGCSAGYNGERLFSKAAQFSASLQENATPEQYAKTIRKFEQVTQKAPGTAWAARAHVAIGSLYAIQKDFPKARGAFGLALQNYNQYRTLCQSARYAIAKTYEAEQNWEEAVKLYEEIAEYNPLTKLGLEAPLYIAAGYAKRQENELAAKAYERAVRRYTKLIPDLPTPEAALTVKGYLVLAYQQLGEWDSTVTLLEEMESAPQQVNRPMVLLSLGSIYQAKRGDNAKAQATYTKLAEEFPDHPFGKIAKARLQHLGVALPPNTPPTPTAPTTP